MSSESTPLSIRYDWLDQLPSRLTRPTVVHVHGDVIARGKTILRLRDALLSGTLPHKDALVWPDEPWRATLLEALVAANVASYCEADPEITDDVLLFMLAIVQEAHVAFDRAFVAFQVLARKDDTEWISWRLSGGVCKRTDERRRPRSVVQSEEEREAIRQDAIRLACDLVAARTDYEWTERIAALAALASIFEELARAVRLPPGSGRGMLRSLPRKDVLRLRALVDRLPAVSNVIRTLGRLQEASEQDGPPVLERIGRAVERLVEANKEIEGERGNDVRGIERSQDVSRMLATEAALLSRPALRKLWRARWAERALLGYHAPGVYTQRIQEKRTFEDDGEFAHARAERGPVIVLLDTSGSMQGVPEDMAKAIAVQLAGTAFMEERRCYVYNFSGPGDLIEHELSFDGDGLGEMLTFLSASFYGGTEIDEALRRACERIQRADWRQADIAIFSDGCFSAGPHTVALVERVKRRTSARVHGITVGAVGGFAQLGCDSIHEVRNWRAVLQ